MQCQVLDCADFEIQRQGRDDVVSLFSTSESPV